MQMNLNAHPVYISITNHSITVEFTEYVLQHDIDIMLVTESWLYNDDHVVIGECTPPGYSFLNIPRPSGRCGGIAVLFKSQLQLRLRSTTITTTYFEFACITDNVGLLNLVVIYRPPPSPINGFRQSDFIVEFDSFMDDVVLFPGQLLLAGDFNVYWDEQDRSDVKQYSSIIASASLHQYVTVPTHRSGHILDHVLCCPDENFIQDFSVHENPLTWHHCVHFKLNLAKPVPQRVTQTLRNYKSIDGAAFSQALTDHLNPIPNVNNPGELYNWYNGTVSDCLDEYAPSETRTRTIRNRQPWYNQTIHTARQDRHRVERKWRKSRSESDSQKYVTARNNVTKRIVEAKQFYYSDKLSGANTKTVFQTVNSLLNSKVKPLPVHNDPKDLGNKFAQFFKSKIYRFAKNLNLHVKMSTPLSLLTVALGLAKFSPSFAT
ncbi:uncharacterized protein [Amphiura filiformis]|uniref:uncharacterized protein n=1 Tax=Amphiura filiformis TaxID=82378 RepID=UPI003B214B94